MELLLKLTHIISATILFGTGIGSAFYMLLANLVNNKKNVKTIYFTVKNVVIADTIFTAPTIIIQVITGLLLAEHHGYLITEGWLFWAIILYIFVIFCWLPVFWIQIKMKNIAKKCLKNNTDLPKKYWQLNFFWIILGCLAFIAMIMIFYLMVFKPI